MTKIIDLTIVDLKAAFEFNQVIIEECKEKARNGSINPENIPAYNEARNRENRIYNELLNRTTLLE